MAWWWNILQVKFISMFLISVMLRNNVTLEYFVWKSIVWISGIKKKITKTFSTSVFKIILAIFAYCRYFYFDVERFFTLWTVTTKSKQYFKCMLNILVITQWFPCIILLKIRIRKFTSFNYQYYPKIEKYILFYKSLFLTSSNCLKYYYCTYCTL